MIFEPPKNWFQSREILSRFAWTWKQFIFQRRISSAHVRFWLLRYGVKKWYVRCGNRANPSQNSDFCMKKNWCKRMMAPTVLFIQHRSISVISKRRHGFSDWMRMIVVLHVIVFISSKWTLWRITWSSIRNGSGDTVGSLNSPSVRDEHFYLLSSLLKFWLQALPHLRMFIRMMQVCKRPQFGPKTYYSSPKNRGLWIWDSARPILIVPWKRRKDLAHLSRLRLRCQRTLRYADRIGPDSLLKRSIWSHWGQPIIQIYHQLYW